MKKFSFALALILALVSVGFAGNHNDFDPNGRFCGKIKKAATYCGLIPCADKIECPEGSLLNTATGVCVQQAECPAPVQCPEGTLLDTQSNVCVESAAPAECPDVTCPDVTCEGTTVTVNPTPCPAPKFPNYRPCRLKGGVLVCPRPKVPHRIFVPETESSASGSIVVK